MVVFPELASYHRCRNQMLKLDEMTSRKCTFSGSCVKCFLDKVSKSSTNAPCKHGIRESELIEQNPKLEDEGTNSGEGFAEDERRFMVDDSLHISPISSISAIMKGIDFLTADLVEKDVSVDKTKLYTKARGASQIYFLQFAMSKISVRFLIDKEQKRVLFAEAGSDFIAVLFSFPTLPLGSIVSLLGEESELGSLDNLFKSVEQLDDKYLQTDACKYMLLYPRSAAAEICEDLMIKNIHVDDPRVFYICYESYCLTQSTCYYTYVDMDRCGRCGKQMHRSWKWRKDTAEKAGVFVDDSVNFIVSDDLRVIPVSLMSAFSLVEELRVKDVSVLEERVVDISTGEALNILRRSLVSKYALTELCFPDGCMEQSIKCFSVIEKKIECSEAEQKIDIKLILNKKNNNVLYAEVGGDFLSQLLSFLTFPLGSVLRLLDGDMQLKSCISNLYSSAETLECFKSEKCKNMVVSPELASHYGCRNQMLKLDEMTSRKGTFPPECINCITVSKLQCELGLIKRDLIEKNPKLKNGGSDSGGCYVEDSRRFMVSDSLHISPLSAITAIKEVGFPISELVEKEVSIGKAEVMSLLSAMLISKTVLTDVFSPKKP